MVYRYGWCANHLIFYKKQLTQEEITLRDKHLETVVEEWKSGRSRLSPTWRSLHHILKQINLKTLSQQIEDLLRPLNFCWASQPRVIPAADVSCVWCEVRDVTIGMPASSSLERELVLNWLSGSYGDTVCNKWSHNNLWMCICLNATLCLMDAN